MSERPPLDVRLPTSLRPLEYNVRLQPFMYSGASKELSFKGSVTVLLECVQTTDNVTLHIKNLQVRYKDVVCFIVRKD